MMFIREMRVGGVWEVGGVLNQTDFILAKLEKSNYMGRLQRWTHCSHKTPNCSPAG